MIDFENDADANVLKENWKAKFPEKWAVKGFRQIANFKKVGAHCIPNAQFEKCLKGSIDQISFKTFKLRKFTYKNNDLSSMLAMYNPMVATNIAKNTKAKEDNAKVSFMSIEPILNGNYSPDALKFLQSQGFGFSFQDNLNSANQDHGHKFNRLMSNLVEI